MIFYKLSFTDNFDPRPAHLIFFFLSVSLADIDALVLEENVPDLDGEDALRGINRVEKVRRKVRQNLVAFHPNHGDGPWRNKRKKKNAILVDVALRGVELKLYLRIGNYAGPRARTWACFVCGEFRNEDEEE